VISRNITGIPYIKIDSIDYESDNESCSTPKNKADSLKDAKSTNTDDDTNYSDDLESWNDAKTESDVVEDARCLITMNRFKALSLEGALDDVHVDKLKKNLIPCISYVYVTHIKNPFDFTVTFFFYPFGFERESKLNNLQVPIDHAA
jgi:hypothetical protein